MIQGALLKLTVDGLTPEKILLVQLLANDLRPSQISNSRSEMNFSHRTIEKKIGELKNDFDCKTVGGLIALFYRQKLIK